MPPSVRARIKTDVSPSGARSHLWLPRISLSSCLRGVMGRDTRGVDLAPADRFNHFPATPLCSINWWLHGDAEGVLNTPIGREARLDDPRGAFGTRQLFCGPCSGPLVSWNRGESHGLVLLLMPDALQLMTGLAPGALVDCFADVRDVLPPDWVALCDAVAAGPNGPDDDDARVALIEDFLDARWQAVRPKQALNGHTYADWAQGLAMRAAQTSVGVGLRQLERRIKLWAGQPMRELQGLGRNERAFFRAIAAAETGRLRWADIAADCGFADQSHLVRATRRMTGFAPADLYRRIREREAFWAYRVWM